MRLAILREPKCYTRSCVHFLGISQPDGTERSERNVCEAFPDGIPMEIAYGKNDHTTPTKDQKNDLVYEKGEMAWQRRSMVDSE